MKILWVRSEFPCPPNSGGRILALNTLQQLHRRHEVHCAALVVPGDEESPRWAAEVCAQAFAVEHRPAPRPGAARLHQIPVLSPAFLAQFARAATSPLPLAVSPWNSDALRKKVAELRASGGYDAVVCDCLPTATAFESLDGVTLVEQNVETMLWRRHAAAARGALRRAYFHGQAERMKRFEEAACRSAKNVIAVSESDAEALASEFGVRRATAVPIGADAEYFSPQPAEPLADLIFLGSMDWAPNADGVLRFYEETWPRIVARRPATTLAVVGRNPSAEILRLAELDSRIEVSGTVDDVRPYLWGAKVSIVPLRIGGGARLKIVESMAAGTPCVSTSIGAEGLQVDPPDEIRIADDSDSFAEECLALLDDLEQRERTARAGLALVREKFTWERVTELFEAAAGWR